MKILGISAYYHDAAAALVIDGKVIAAAQEERFSRVKHDAQFPKAAINFCLEFAGLSARDLDYVVFYDKPFLKFDRLLETYLAFAPSGFANFRASFPVWIKEKLFQKSLIIRELRTLSDVVIDWPSKLKFSEHHLSHAASAFFPSPYESAAIVTIDGVGEWSTTSIFRGSGRRLELIKEIQFPDSIGLLYSAFTQYLGFKVNGGEYKIMGLAPYGTPRYASLIKQHLIDLREDGSFSLNMKYFGYCTDLSMTSAAFHKLFGGPPRQPESEISSRDMDLAASIQVVVEEAVLNLAREAAHVTGEQNLCLAGGVALNCVANGLLLRSKVFEKMWIQPAAGDAGGALGAALVTYYMMLETPRLKTVEIDDMDGALLGPAYSDQEGVSSLESLGASFEVLSEELMIERAARTLAAGGALGWFQGRMEFGPRALGARSILADPRSPEMQRTLNLKIKYRESFRPFAPSVLIEEAQNWFQLEVDSPYMLFVADLAPAHRHGQPLTLPLTPSLYSLEAAVCSEIPAVTHVDYSARVQTVSGENNPRFYRLLKRFHELTGCPVLVNTSFNIRGEPIVCSPDDAYRCFMGTDLDALALGLCWLDKSNQAVPKQNSYRNSYPLD